MKTEVFNKKPLVEQMDKQSHPRKGIAFRDAALRFLEKWPINSTLTWKEFSEWAVEEGLLNSCPSYDNPMLNKQGDGWLAHLQRRHQIKGNINKAAQHSDMIPYGGAFSIESVSGALMVRPVVEMATNEKRVESIRRLAVTERKQLGYLVQATDWSQVLPHERAVAETLLADIDDWITVIGIQAEQRERRFQSLRQRIARSISLEIKSLPGKVDNE